MRKNHSTRTKNFGSVTLYRDSIDEITTLLHSNLYAPQLGDKQFEYDTVEELLTERGEVLRDLTITGAGNDSDVNIQISWRLGSKLEVVNNDALFLTISDLLKKHHRNYLYFGLMLVSFLFLASYFALATLGAGKWILVSMAGLGITFGSF